MTENNDTFVCHEIEWFKGDVCLICEAEANALLQHLLPKDK